MIEKTLSLLRKHRFLLNDEKKLQVGIYHALIAEFPGLEIHREVTLGRGDIIDFMVGEIGIEVKIKGGKRAIYRQCCRYCKYPHVRSLILATNISLGFPAQINGKDCYVINLGKAWL